MDVTEVLVTGYNRKGAVFAVNLMPDVAAVVLTSMDDNGVTVVDSAWQQSTDAFTAVQEVLAQIVGAPMPAH